MASIAQPPATFFWIATGDLSQSIAICRAYMALYADDHDQNKLMLGHERV